jgi:hypothetical protein
VNSLVQYLSEGTHPVEVNPGPERTAKALQECIDRGYVHVKFTDTRGGTELGTRLDKAASDVASADFVNATGTVKLVGGLTLNYVKVQCVANIDLATMSGTGHLIPTES